MALRSPRCHTMSPAVTPPASAQATATSKYPSKTRAPACESAGPRSHLTALRPEQLSGCGHGALGGQAHEAALVADRARAAAARATRDVLEQHALARQQMGGVARVGRPHERDDGAIERDRDVARARVVREHERGARGDRHEYRERGV